MMPHTMVRDPLLEDVITAPLAHAQLAPEVRQAHALLRAAFALVPIIAGIDKFLHRLVPWEQYVAPRIADLLPMSAQTFMQVVGVVEIVAGALVWAAPRWGGYVVAVWLWGIIANLLLIPGYYDIALRDFALSLGALALARISAAVHRHDLDASQAISGESHVV